MRLHSCCRMVRKSLGFVDHPMSTPKSEVEFSDSLVARLENRLLPHRVAQKMSLLYDLSFDSHGRVAMGVDPDTGEPIRGKGKGFEQDLLIYDEVSDGHTSVVPRIVVELKFGNVTTHDVIVYSEKADRIRRVYPYVRYGFLLGGLENIPGRVLRLGQRFDFIASLNAEPSEAEFEQFVLLMQNEAKTSIDLCELLFGKVKVSLYRKGLTIGWPSDRA
jgi:hypothetical protein